MTQPSGKDLWGSLVNWSGPGGTTTATPSGTTATGAPPKPPSQSGSTSSGITFQQYTAPAGPQGGALPAGTVYTIGSNGSLSIDYRPPAPSGGGSVSVSLNPNSTAAWGRVTDQAGNIWMVNELDPSQNYILFPAQSGGTGSDPRDLNSDGLDDKTGYALGVYSVSTSVSPTGFVYRGQPVWPDGSPYTGGSKGEEFSQIIGSSTTGYYAVYPDGTTKKLDTGVGAAAQSGPVGSGGGGGGSSAYSSIATQMLSNQGALARIEAESAARAAAAQQEADLQKQLIRLQQDFQREQAAITNALAAAGQYAQMEVANRQLEEAYNQRRVMLIGEYRDALKDYDARAVFDAIRGSGTLEQALNTEGDFLTDNANAGAAALLGEINRPFTPLQPYDPYRFMNGGMSGGIGGTPGGGTPAGGTPTGGDTPTGGGMAGGLGGGSQIGSAMPFTAPNVDMTEIIAGLRAAGASDADIAQLQADIASGKRSAQDFMLSGYYKSLTGNPNFLRGGDLGTQMVGPLSSGTDRFYDTWQAVDPFGSNYNPAILPKEQTIPANHPLAGGLTGGQTAPALGGGTRTGELEQQAVIPMLAGGGMTGGLAIAGEAGKPELVIGDAMVVPLPDHMAGKLMNNGVPGFATGGFTLSRTTRDPYGTTAPSPISSPAPIPYSEPVQQAIPQVTTGGSGVVQPSPVTTTSTPTPVTSSVPSSPVPSPTPAQPPVTTTNPTQPATTTSQPTSPFSPASQELLDTVMAYRQGTADMNIGFTPWDVAWNTLTPFEQNLYYQNEAQKRGVPADLLAQDVARRRLPGFAGSLAGRQGY